MSIKRWIKIRNEKVVYIERIFNNIKSYNVTFWIRIVPLKNYIISKKIYWAELMSQVGLDYGFSRIQCPINLINKKLLKLFKCVANSSVFLYATMKTIPNNFVHLGYKYNVSEYCLQVNKPKKREKTTQT